MAGITVRVAGREGVVKEVSSSGIFRVRGKLQLEVWTEFSPPLESRSRIWLCIPALKDYTPEKFIKAVEEGLVIWLQMERQIQAECRLREQQEADLKALAREVAADLGLEGPTD